MKRIGEFGSKFQFREILSRGFDRCKAMSVGFGVIEYFYSEDVSQESPGLHGQ